MARLPKGVEPTPHNIRLQRSRAALIEAGGKTVVANLNADAVEDLRKVQESGGNLTITAAISQALKLAASRLQ